MTLGLSNVDPTGEVTLVLRDFYFSNGMLRGLIPTIV